MKPAEPLFPGDPNEEISALIATLHQAGRRLEKLTAGEVDSVVDQTGRVYLFKGVQAQLRRAEDSRQAAVLNALPAHIALLDARGLIVSVNEAWRQIDCANAIQSPGHRIGLNYLEICDSAPGDGSSEARQVAEGIRSVLAGRAKTFSIEYSCHLATEQLWFLLTVTPLADDHPNGVVVMHLNITERKRADEKQRAASQLLDNIVENIPTAVQLKSVQDDFRVVKWNKAAESMYGLPRDEAIGRNVHDLWPEADADRMHAADLDLLATGNIQNFPDRLAKTRTRGDIHVHMRKVALLDAGGKATHVLVIADDISDKLKHDEELRRFRAAMDISADAIVLIDRASMRYIDVNQTLCEMAGYTRQDLLRMTPMDLLGKSRETLEREYDALIANSDSAVSGVESEYRLKDGSLLPIETRRKAFRGETGWIIVGITRDITERKRAEQDLRESEARFRSLSLLSSDWFWEQDENHRFVNFSGGQGVEGWGPDQNLAVGLHRWDLGGVKPIGCSWEEHKGLLDAHKPFRKFEYQRILGDGRLQYVEASGEPIFDAGGRFSGYRGVATEITQRKEAENRIRRLNRVYAVLSGINTLIVRVRDRDELFREACRIAVEAGEFKMAWIGVLDRQTLDGKVVAWHGGKKSFLDMVSLTAREGTPSSDWPGCRALRLLQPSICNDFATDPSARTIRDELLKRGHRSAGCFPLTVAGRREGVLCLFAGEPHVFDDEETRLLAELSGDISLALEHIEKAEKLIRTTRVNAMLSGINGAIVRHPERNSLFREVCRIAVTDGGFTVARVVELDLNGKARIAASSESDSRIFQRVVDDYNNDPEHCQNLLAIGLRSGRLLVSNDVANDTRMPRRAELTKDGNYALALLPIIVEQRIAGVAILRSRESGIFDEVEQRLLLEVVANVSFALEHIGKEAKVRRLTRVYAVLSGINALIVRAGGRDELLKSACRIAVEQGKFTMAWIGTVDRSAMELVPVASAGTTQDPLALINQRFRLDVDAPSGNTISARVIREKKAAISNDVQNDPEVLFKEEHALRGSRAMALFPLKIAGEVEGLLALYSNEVGFFDDEEVKLLDELAGDIAFAIDNLRKQERLDYLAYYDVLTGLANRRLFLERVAQYMRSAAGNGHKLALFFLDLERFRNINDSLGRPAGDALLKQVADWLARGVGDAHLLGRLGEDHFAVVLPELKAEGNVAGLIEKSIRAFLDHAFLVGDTELRISVKVGVALFPDDAVDADALLRNAEVALKKAKARGDRYLFYRQKMNKAAAGKLTLENQLRQALDNEEFVLHYQPKVSLDTGRLTSCEALIRWNDPRTGLVPPGRFIPVLEETGLIYNVGRWALRKAVGDFLRCRAAGLAPLRIAVNVSPLQLRHAGFISEIEQVIGIEADAAAGLELEITESLIMEDVKHSIASLKAIRAMGVTIAIDDFGTGFSSLSYLAKLPVDTLKIDRSFVIDMTAGPEGLALVSTIINLAHSLKLNVVAEGVETEEQSRLLRLLRCDEMQGFLFSKAVPAEIFEAKFLATPATG